VQTQISSGRDAYHPVEKAGEVTLIGESYFERGAHNAVPLEKKLASLVYSALNKVILR